MRFLSVAERELLAASRHVATYRIRWITAAGFLGLLLWMFWVFDAFSRRGSGLELFRALTAVIFFYCLLVGTARTADCLSSEKREGTLGLLFLTNLTSLEIVAGKLCSSALAAMYGMLAIFPILALPLLMGGVTFEFFWRTVLALVNAVFFAVAAGFVASSVCVRQFPAVALATGLALFFSVGLMGLAEAIRALGRPVSWTGCISVFSPLCSLVYAERPTRLFGLNQYWLSLAVVAGLSWSWLGLVAWRLARTWRDRPKAVRPWSRLRIWERWRVRGATGRAALRRRLLEINPFFWLASRQQVSAPAFMVLVLALVSLNVFVAAPYFQSMFRAQAGGALGGSVFAWLWTGLALHGLALYYAAAAASQRLAEDKQTGALELILSTPVTERSISRGLWLAYGRRMLVPGLMALLANFFFIWQGATLLAMERPDNLPPGLTPAGLMWAALFDQPVRGVSLHWSFHFASHVLLLVMVLFVASWVALGWVGRWLGLRMKHPGFAPMTALALLLAPPILLFSFACYLADELKIDRMPERQFMPMMMWIAFGIGIMHCVLLSAWAAGNLRRELRTTVTRRFQPASLHRWWRPNPRAVLRFAVRTAVFVLALALIVVSFLGYQNWHSQRAWVVFQRELKQKGETLELSALLPGPVPDDQNFARTLAFQNLLNQGRSGAQPVSPLLEALPRFETTSGYGIAATATFWTQQRFTDFKEHLTWMRNSSGTASGTNRQETAALALDGLKPLAEMMSAVSANAHLPFFQPLTNRDAAVVMQQSLAALSLMERLHFLFQLRACALVAVNRAPEAGDDVLTSLHLARLARQSAAARTSVRVQYMVARSLQPLWEGLAEHRWSETQLAAFQLELAGFQLLSDHSNAIRRVVLAQIEVWRAIPDSPTPLRSVPQMGGVYVSGPVWQLQPRSWWWEHCVQLYQVGESAIRQVDVPGGRVALEYNGRDLSGLPLDGESMQLLQGNYSWGGNPSSVAFAQNGVNQAIIACALERFRLANGVYPESLEQLKSAFLESIPYDVIRGRPMLYQHLDAGSFILRGVGPNETNDQNTKAGSDDWLWTYATPTNAAPAAATPGGRP